MVAAKALADGVVFCVCHAAITADDALACRAVGIEPWVRGSLAAMAARNASPLLDMAAGLPPAHGVILVEDED
jgi:hypothetical protein